MGCCDLIFEMTCFNSMVLFSPVIPSGVPKNKLVPDMICRVEASVGYSGINPEVRIITQIGVITNQPMTGIFQLLN